ncbi:MAG: cytidine deaminase [Kiritimatiellae bacterium]|nr:cytidine deaminase [Kiritimatiellia bacterium]
MDTLTLVITAKQYPLAELAPDDRALFDAATATARTAYAPYSHFRVGVALRLASGALVTGSNQENAAYPSGICAERNALFAAGTAHPDTSVSTLVLTALAPDGSTVPAISPCGACRQVIMETESRHGRPIRILLCGADGVLEFPSAHSLLPFWTQPPLN